MYIWLPYADAQKTAECLRTEELVQNERNTRRILSELATGLGPFSRYPGVRMFAGSYAFLVRTGQMFSHHLDTQRIAHEEPSHAQFYASALRNSNGATQNAPAWWNRTRVHDSHKAYLLHKAAQEGSAHYRELWPNVKASRKPVWPIPYQGKQRYEQVKRTMEARA